MNAQEARQRSITKAKDEITEIKSKIKNTGNKMGVAIDHLSNGAKAYFEEHGFVIDEYVCGIGEHTRPAGYEIRWNK